MKHHRPYTWPWERQHDAEAMAVLVNCEDALDLFGPQIEWSRVRAAAAGHLPAGLTDDEARMALGLLESSTAHVPGYRQRVDNLTRRLARH